MVHQDNTKGQLVAIDGGMGLKCVVVDTLLVSPVIKYEGEKRDRVFRD